MKIDVLMQFSLYSWIVILSLSTSPIRLAFDDQLILQDLRNGPNCLKASTLPFHDSRGDRDHLLANSLWDCHCVRSLFSEFIHLESSVSTHLLYCTTKVIMTRCMCVTDFLKFNGWHFSTNFTNLVPFCYWGVVFHARQCFKSVFQAASVTLSVKNVAWQVWVRTTGFNPNLVILLYHEVGQSSFLHLPPLLQNIYKIGLLPHAEQTTFTT